MEKKALLEIAKIINTHGVHGNIKLEPWCDSPDVLKTITKVYLDNGTEFALSDVRIINGGFVLCSLSGITTVEAAVKLKNKILYARREDIPLPEGAHFICDLIGLPVIDARTGTIYGTLADIMQNTVQEIYAVKTESGETILLPAVPEYVSKIDPEAGIFITPIEGFFA